MTITEALRSQLDNLQKEKQELEIRNLKLSDNPSKETLREVEKERDQWKDECERITVENEQLKALYEELLQNLPAGQTNTGNSGIGHQTIAELQEQTKTQQTDLEQWKFKCKEVEKELSSINHWKTRSKLLEREMGKLQHLNGELEKKIVLVENNLELECFRSEAKARSQWEAHEGRLVEQLTELQQQLKGKEIGRGPLQTLGKDVSIEGLQNISVPSKATLTSANVSKNKQTECPSYSRLQEEYNGRI